MEWQSAKNGIRRWKAKGYENFEERGIDPTCMNGNDMRSTCTLNSFPDFSQQKCILEE